MKILVLNAGSSSQKIALFDSDDSGDGGVPTAIWTASIEWKDDKGAGKVTTRLPDASEPRVETLPGGGSRQESVSAAILALWSGDHALLSGAGEIGAVGHRVVHGGQKYRETTRITAEVKSEIANLAPLAPAHNPAALEGIAAAEKLFGAAVPQFAAFDTAFHRTLPDAAAVYPGPYSWWEEGIRRYGFHGISHRYCSERAAQLLGRDASELRLITCHLGNGCSLAAIRGGKSVDTTMGFTPLDGLMMGTRSGSVDPGILLYRLQEKGDTAATLEDTLNQESGLKGISGVAGDMREITKAIAGGNERAKLAFDVFVHRLRWHIGAMLPALGGLDAIVFAGGIGEHSAAVRAAACEGLGFLGIELDAAKNDAWSGPDGDVAAAASPARIFVVTTEEDAAIARDCARLSR